MSSSLKLRIKKSMPVLGSSEKRAIPANRATIYKRNTKWLTCSTTLKNRTDSKGLV